MGSRSLLQHFRQQRSGCSNQDSDDVTSCVADFWRDIVRRPDAKIEKHQWARSGISMDNQDFLSRYEEQHPETDPFAQYTNIQRLTTDATYYDALALSGLTKRILDDWLLYTWNE